MQRPPPPPRHRGRQPRLAAREARRPQQPATPTAASRRDPWRVLRHPPCRRAAHSVSRRAALRCATPLVRPAGPPAPPGLPRRPSQGARVGRAGWPVARRAAASAAPLSTRREGPTGRPSPSSGQRRTRLRRTGLPSRRRRRLWQRRPAHPPRQPTPQHVQWRGRGHRWATAMPTRRWGRPPCRAKRPSGSRPGAQPAARRRPHALSDHPRTTPTRRRWPAVRRSPPSPDRSALAAALARRRRRPR
mmetsp:Transcript_20351/g.52102  ORF Transcript_20351/g.52102 Transcript_20351/m.52102 type:complete len:246 (+) Transcript_20351:892-1629(+)